MRALILLIIGLSTISLSAQQEQPIKRISTGIKIGTEIGFMGLESSNFDANTEVGVGYSIIVDFLEYQINDQFSANIGVGFTNRKYRQKIKSVSLVDILAEASGREHLLIQNVEIPITGKYYFEKKDSRQLYLIGGATVYYNLRNSSQQELFFSDGTTWEYNHQNNVTRTTLAATFGAGLQFDTNYHISYIIEPILQINPNQISFLYGRDANALIAVGLMAGMKF